MSTLQVSNIHLESTGNNRIQYTGTNSVAIVVGGANVMSANATTVDMQGKALTNAVGLSLGLTKISTYTANATWAAANSSLKAVKVTLLGGGGSGARQGYSYTPGPSIPAPTGSWNTTGVASGGGAGGIAIHVLPVAIYPELLSPVSVTVGLGGAANTVTNVPTAGTPGANGNSGGTTSFGTILTATGGGGGIYSPISPTAVANGGTAGIGSNGISTVITMSTPGTRSTSPGPYGQANGIPASSFGNGGRHALLPSGYSENAPVRYGMGGDSTEQASGTAPVVSGASVLSGGPSGGTVNAASGPGYAGYAIIEEYY